MAEAAMRATTPSNSGGQSPPPPTINHGPGDESNAAPAAPAPKRRKTTTTKKSAAGGRGQASSSPDPDDGVPSSSYDQDRGPSPSGRSILDLAAVASQALSPNLSTSAIHHTPTMIPSVLAPGPSTTPSSSVVSLPPGAGAPLSIKDLVSFRDGLRVELATMRSALSRMESFITQGDALLSIIDASVLPPAPPPPPPQQQHSSSSASTSHFVKQVPQPPPSSRPTRPSSLSNSSTTETNGAPTTVPAKRTGSPSERQTEEDLEDYLRGLPEMDAVGLRLSTGGAGPVAGGGTGGTRREGSAPVWALRNPSPPAAPVEVRKTEQEQAMEVDQSSSL
ncbi:hypothetical protein T439DRAFT_30565 [Meredithblackwellia eburnea MCA 4105]